jgi:(E)-4-hydroxy-3-methylbut-2-enyl-diphosphate synthase
MITREKTRKINVGGVVIGGGAPVVVQSMTTTDTRDVGATLRQIRQLEEAGCEIVRVGVPDLIAAQALGKIKKGMSVPLVADIHFDYRLALEAIRQGVDKLRINPGNIGATENVAAVVTAAKKARVPIRIGVNAGSLKVLRHGHRTVKERAAGLVKAALDNIKLLESLDFYDIAVSLKASDVTTTVEAYRLLAAKKDYPLHLGITEAGSMFRGTIKSSAGLAILLYGGLGDTVRVSLTADPVEEVKVAYQLLQALELRSTGIDIVSCPTCSRCEADLIGIVTKFEEELARLHSLTSKAFRKRPLKVAIMGCVVNGPGEAREADIGIAGGKGAGVLFENGKVTGKVAPDKWVKTLIKLVKEKAQRCRR